MSRLMVNLAMDDSIREDIIKFIREQVRPIIREELRGMLGNN